MDIPSSTNEPRVVKCTSFDEFTAIVRAPHWGVPTIYRGQRDVTWPLSSFWERLLKYYRDGFHEEGKPAFFGERPGQDIDELFGPEGREHRNRFRDDYLNTFRQLIIGLPGVQSEDLKNDKRVWALGRHHGLVTPLLDWTHSPYIALYFACLDYAEFHNAGLTKGLRGAGGYINFIDPAPVAVWELALKTRIQVEGEFEIVECRVDQSHRQKAQQGLFTFLEHSKHIDIEAYLRDRNLARALTRFELPGTEVGRALWNLRRMNIRHASLFPDIDGAAIEANILSAIGVTSMSYDLRKDVLQALDGEENKESTPICEDKSDGKHEDSESVDA